MGVITISRQMGSRGTELALGVAQHFGWRCVSRDLINQAARSAGAPEVALAEIDELGIFDLHPSAKAWRAYRHHVERIIRELAAEGDVVIVGRGGQIVLRDQPDALHIRVVAPPGARSVWLQQEKNVSATSALVLLEKSDKSRARYLKRSYGLPVNDPTLYHLVLNTGLLDLARAANLIVQTFETLRGEVIKY